MVSVVVITEPPIAAAPIGADVRNAGYHVVQCDTASEWFLQEVVRLGPGLVIAVSPSASDLLLKTAASLSKLSPCPFVLFTADADPATIERAEAAGVHNYVVDGYAPDRLRGVVQVAIARFRQEQLRSVPAPDRGRVSREHKLIEQAKAVLMRSRDLSETDAFERMRGLAMRRRLGMAQIADYLVSLSIGGEAVNRAGQLRMLSQRVVRCYIQLAFGVHAEQAATTMRECTERIDNNIAILSHTVAERGCAPDLERITAGWVSLAAAVAPPVLATGITAVDAYAEALMQDAEALTGFLETSGLVTNLRLINLAGRQRMLSQRIGKLCLLLALDTSADAAVTAARTQALGQSTAAFGRALAELQRMPIRTPAIEGRLGAAEAKWAAMAPFLYGQGDPAQCVERCEQLLDVMDALTDAYEQAMQLLVGDGIDTLEPIAAE